MRRSILLVNPAYHYSFFLMRELRKLGWRADVYKGRNYPDKLLYSRECVNEGETGHIWFDYLCKIILFIKIIIRYKYFLVYGGTQEPEIFSLIPGRYKRFVLPVGIMPELWLLKILGKKLICYPNGCLQEVLRRDFEKHEDGRVCANCGWSDKACDDEKNRVFFEIRNRYFNYVIANTPVPSKRITKHLIKERTLDLSLFQPTITVPETFRLPVTRDIRVLHGFYNKDREHKGRNIKGTPYVLEAIDRLKDEGYPVESLCFQDIPSKYMRFYQAQTDIVIDQLIYGWWGSSGIEGMALGKPVVCHITPLWKRLFLETFCEYDDLPVVEANTENIYEVLKELVLDEEYRKQKGEESRRFAERHFDARNNAVGLQEIFLSL
jgi:glycosyltransferase involved in cell wall biosynthesis